MILKDKNSLAKFDDFVHNPENEDYEMPYWTQVCDGCAIGHNLLDSYLDMGSGHGICGVVFCTKEADHYYDFDGEEIEAKEILDKSN